MTKRARGSYFDWKYRKGAGTKEIVRPNAKLALAWYPLVDPFEIGNFKASHRVCVAPVTSNRAKFLNHTLSPMQIEYFKIRLTEGSVVFGEAMSVSKQGCISARVSGMFTDEHEETIEELFATAKENNALFIPQLTHGGKLCPDTVTDEALSCDGIPQPSELPDGFTPEQFLLNGAKCTFAKPVAMTALHIQQVIAEFKQSALRLKRAGCTVCNICMAGSNLLHEFLLRATNPRNDRYGATNEDRARLPLAVFDAVAEVFGSGNVGVSFSFGYSVGGNVDVHKHDLRTHLYMARELNKRKAHHYTTWFRYENQINAPATDDYVESYGKWKELRDALRKEFKGPIISSGYSLREPTEAVEDIISNNSEMVMFGFASICNPDLPNRIRHGIGYSKNLQTFSRVPQDATSSECENWSESDQARGYIDWQMADLPEEPPHVIHL